jgi:hypothetical protein
VAFNKLRTKQLPIELQTLHSEVRNDNINLCNNAEIGHTYDEEDTNTAEIGVD